MYHYDVIYVRSDGGDWWYMYRSGFVSLLSKRLMGDPAIRMAPLGGHWVAAVPPDAPRYEPFNWTEDQTRKALSMLSKGLMPPSSPLSSARDKARDRQGGGDEVVIRRNNPSRVSPIEA